ncbi:MAG: AbrB family transcriptional regulator, partial [Maritimibacter sp.]|nr:AbrB family transcriptional regulator [Maritimibacter sp.]
MTLPPWSHIMLTAILLAAGAVTGVLFQRLGTPLPYMLGSLFASALAVAFAQRHFPEGYAFPMKFRMLFVGVIGAMIGARLIPDVAALLPRMLVSIPAVLVFVLAAHALNYLILRRVGGYDRPTAYYAGSPGGLFESILFGEEAGADLRLLTLMQFLRIISVVTLVPVAMSIWEGHPVGSAAGVDIGGGEAALAWVPGVLALALAGVWIGLRLKLPAGQLIGPLVLVGALSVTGLVEIAAPGWLIAVAQVVLGTSLGVRFTGMTLRVFLRGAGLSILSVTAMMAVGIV